MTGHHSDCVRVYKRTNDEMLKRASKSISEKILKFRKKNSYRNKQTNVKDGRIVIDLNMNVSELK